MMPLPEREAWALLDRARVAHVAMCGDDGPYVVPMSFVIDGTALAFRTGGGVKVDILRTHPQICLVADAVDEDGRWVSAMIRGRARFVDDEEMKGRIVAALFTKYRREMGDPLSFSRPGVLPQEEIVIAIDVDEITGRRSGGLFAPRTRPGRL